MQKTKLTTSELANLIMVSRTTITNLVAAGMPKEARATFDLEEAVQWYINRLLHSRDIAGEDTDYDKEKTRLTKEQADKIEMENAVKRGELLNIQIVFAIVENLFNNIKQKLLSIPVKTAHRVRGADEISEIKSILESEITSVLSELSTGGVFEKIRITVTSEAGTTPEADGLGVGGSEQSVKQRNSKRAGKVADKQSRVSKRNNGRGK